MRRKLLGIISLLLILAAIYGLITYGVGDNQASMVTSMCLRIGLVLGAIWLAFPQLIKLSGSISPWSIALVGVAAIIVIARPKTILVLGPILMMLGLLHMAGKVLKATPKKKRGKR